MNKIAILALLFTTGCKSSLSEDFYAVIFVNNSNKEIGLLYVAPFSPTSTYPDTTLPPNKPEFLREVKANSTHTIYIGAPHEEVFAAYPRDTMSLYLFDQDTLDAFSWDTIRQGYKLLERKDIDLGTLKTDSYIISYP